MSGEQKKRTLSDNLILCNVFENQVSAQYTFIKQVVTSQRLCELHLTFTGVFAQVSPHKDL
jgi:hypothetical protein